MSYDLFQVWRSTPSWLVFEHYLTSVGSRARHRYEYWGVVYTKEFYLLLYSIALRTFLLLSSDIHIIYIKLSNFMTAKLIDMLL